MSGLFGLLAAFDGPDSLKAAVARLLKDGYVRLEAYTPYPVEEVGKIVEPGRKAGLPLLMFAAAVAGAAWGFWIQYWDEAVNYPINVGGRPHDSWPAFIVSAFEIMLLATVAAGFLGILVASRLPKLYHPVFDAPGFAHASRDGFLLCVEAEDPRFEPGALRSLLEQLGAQEIEEVRS